MTAPAACETASDGVDGTSAPDRALDEGTEPMRWTECSSDWRTRDATASMGRTDTLGATVVVVDDEVVAETLVGEVVADALDEVVGTRAIVNRKAREKREAQRLENG